MNVVIERSHTGYPAPEYAFPNGTSGFDLICREVTAIYSGLRKLSDEEMQERILVNEGDTFVLLHPFERALFATKQQFILPDGYEIQIRPKSGVTLKTGILVQLGTVDSNYRGDLGISTVNSNNVNVLVPLNSKLAQGVLVKVDRVDFNTISRERFDEYDTLRNTGGFGSTGIK